MKRITILLIATVVGFLGITLLATRQYATADKSYQHAGHEQTKTPKKPMTDGSIDQSKIPDIDAQEILFKILTTSNPNDKQNAQRKQSFLRVNGFTDGEAAAITHAAYEYKRRIAPLDTEVDNIKKQHWPKPSANARGQLAQLQRQKEIIVADSIISPLKVQLRSYAQTEKLDKFLVNEIKKKTKGFAVELPTNKISRVDAYLSNIFTVSAQAPGCDTQIYVYSSTWVDYGDGYVYCENSYSAPYNNCGHTYNLSWSLYNLPWTSSISLWGVDLAGTTIQAFADVEGYCEQASPPQNFQAGNNSSQAQPDPYVQITGLSITETNWPYTSLTRDCTATYGFTNGASGTIYYNPGIANLNIQLGGLSVQGSSGWRELTLAGTMSWTYEKQQSTLGSFKAWGVFKGGTVKVLGDRTSTGGDPVTAIAPQNDVINMTQN